MLQLLPLAEAVAGVLATFLFLMVMLATVMLAIRVTNAANAKKMKAAAAELGMDFDAKAGEITGTYQGQPMSMKRYSSDSSVNWTVRANLKRYPNKRLLASSHVDAIMAKATRSPSDFTVDGRTMTLHQQTKVVSELVDGLTALANAGKFLSDDTADGLLAAFQKQSGAQRREMLALLCDLHRPDKRVEKLLKECLKSDDIGLVFASASQLRTQGIPALLDLVERNEWGASFKSQVVAALKPHLDDRKVLEVVQHLLSDDESPAVRAECAEMLLEQGRTIPTPTLAKMAERSAREAAIAAKLLGQVRHKPDVARLISLTGHQSSDVREAAIESLGKVPGPEANEPLQSIRGRDNRDQVEKAIRRIQMRSQGAPGQLSISENASGGGLSVSAGSVGGELTVTENAAASQVAEDEAEQEAAEFEDA